MDITSIQKLFEAGGLFKPASDDSIAGRPNPPENYWYEVYQRDRYGDTNTIREFETYAEALMFKNAHPDDDFGIDKWMNDGEYSEPVSDWTPEQEVNEAGLFKPATDADVINREDVEAQKLRAERTARQAEVGADLQYLMNMVPLVRALEQQLMDMPIGNHGERDDEGFPTKVSFSIKIYNIKVPEWAREKYDSLGLESRAEYDIQQEMANQLEMFAEGLQNDINIIDAWFQDGRMGGWLVLDLASVTDMHDVRRIVDNYDNVEFVIDDTDDWHSRDFVSAIDDLDAYKRLIEKRIEDLSAIARRVEKARRNVEKMFSSDEYWQDFFERYEQEAEEAVEESV